MKQEFVSWGAIKVMLGVDGKMLPETFCPECGSIMVPIADEKESDTAFQKYRCTHCEYAVNRGEIDACRKYLRDHGRG